MLKSLIFSSMLLAASLCAQTPEWRFDFPGELKQTASRNADCAIDESQKTPDYYTSVRIKTGTDAAFSCLPGKQTLERAERCRLSFFIKAGREKEKSDAAEGKERRFRCRPNGKKWSFKSPSRTSRSPFTCPIIRRFTSVRSHSAPSGPKFPIR